MISSVKLTLVKAVRIEQGKPRGMHYMATIGTGYQYNAFAETNLTPFINVNYQKVSLKSYTEKGEISSTTMSFNIPDRKSVITEIGARIDGNVNLKENISVTPSLVGISGELSAQTNNINYGVRAGSRLSKNTKFWFAGLFCKYSF